MNFLNNTKKQHAYSQVEQRLNTANPSAKKKNQKIYSYTIKDRETYALELDSENGKSITQNLSFLDLYSFDIVNKKDRLNFENIFTQYESRIYVNTENLLAKINLANSDIKSEILEIFISKMINILRSPFSVNKVLNTFGSIRAYKPTDPKFLKIYNNVLSGRNPRQSQLCSDLEISAQEYRDWLSVLFMLLVRLEDNEPNILELTIKSLYENPLHQVMVHIYEYEEKYCLLSDRGFSVPLPENEMLSFDFNLNSHSFIRYIFADIEKFSIKKVPQSSITAYKNLKKTIEARYIRNDLKMLNIYNQHVIYQCKNNVYCASNDLNNIFFDKTHEQKNDKIVWQTKPFEDCIMPIEYTSKIQRKDFLSEGRFPIVSQEAEFVNGYWEDEDDVFKVKTPVIIFGDHTQILKYVDFDFVLGADGVKILLPCDFLNPKFFFYQLQAVNFSSLGYARHYRLLKELEIKYPPLPEQHRIVAILDKAFEAIATAKTNAEKNLKNARELFESYLNQVFMQRGEGWVETMLGEAFDVRDGTHDSPKYQSKGYPLITSKNLKRDGLSFDNVKLISENDYIKINERSCVHRGDVLLAMIGTIGNPTIVEVEPNFAIKNVALFKNPYGQSSTFLKHYLNSSWVISKMMMEAKGTTQKFVGLGYLRGFPINLPNLTTQLQIVEELNKLAEQTQHLESLYKQKISALDELKKSILHKAFSGEL